MNGVKNVLCLLAFNCIACYAIKVDDVQKLTVNNFFGQWSKFLDQVLQEQKEQISPENEKIYQAFIQQAKKLDIPKVTGNKNSVSGMQEQMKALEKRVGDEKKVMQDWKTLSEEITNAAQPISPENEEKYQTVIKQAKDVGIAKKELDTIETKMKELQDKFGVMPAPESKIPAPVMAPATVVKKEESIPVHEETEKK
jgi:hypothetical protein